MSSDENSTSVAGNSSDSIVGEEYVDLYQGLIPRFVLGQKLSADLREGAVDPSDLGEEDRLQPYLVNHNGKNYVSIFGDKDMQNEDHVFMIIGPKKVVSVPSSAVYILWCELAPPKGYSWGNRAGKIRFCISDMMARYRNSLTPPS